MKQPLEHTWALSWDWGGGGAGRDDFPSPQHCPELLKTSKLISITGPGP